METVLDHSLCTESIGGAWSLEVSVVDVLVNTTQRQLVVRTSLGKDTMYTHVSRLELRDENLV